MTGLLVRKGPINTIIQKKKNRLRRGRASDSTSGTCGNSRPSYAAKGFSVNSASAFARPNLSATTS